MLARTEVADALALSPGHVAVRIHRMKEQIQSARAVVRALRTRPGCPDLRAAAVGWDGTPNPLWRKRLARHVRDCASCGRLGTGLVPIDRLLAGLSLLPLPASLSAHFPSAALPPAASQAVGYHPRTRRPGTPPGRPHPAVCPPTSAADRASPTWR